MDDIRRSDLLFPQTIIELASFSFAILVRLPTIPYSLRFYRKPVLERETIFRVLIVNRTLARITYINCQRTKRKYIVYPKKYANGFCFAVLCCGYTLTDFPISIRLTSLALWQSNDCPSASKATLMNMDKYFM